MEALGGPQLKSIKCSADLGALLSIRLWIPPNIATAAQRDKIVVKLELGVGDAFMPPERVDKREVYRLEAPTFLALGLVEGWCGGKVAGLLQLDCDALRQLLIPLEGQRVIYSLADRLQPLAWDGNRLSGVHPFLVKAKVEPESSERPLKPVHKKRTESVPRQDERRMQVDGSTQFLAITLPDRESELYAEAVDLVQIHGFKLEPSNRKWWLRDRHKTLCFLSEYWQRLKSHFKAEFSDNFKQRTASISRATVDVSVRQQGDGFDVTLRLQAAGVETMRLQQCIQKSQNYLETGKGIVLIETATIEDFQEAQCGLAKRRDRPLAVSLKRRLLASELADAEAILEPLSRAFQLPEEWRKRSNVLKDLSQLAAAPIGAGLADKLRPYQRIGVAWLWHLYQNQLAGILADEMGLGKTVQALALLSCMQGGTSLVVCPAGLIENWCREVQSFTPQLRVFAHYRGERLNAESDFGNYDLIISSYSTLCRDLELFKAIDFNTIVADEAQHIKNRQTQNAKALRALKSRGRFMLTGTPVENHLDDLASLFEFLLPGYLTRKPTGARSEEAEWYEERMRQQVAPYILRRRKQQVAPELPDKIEQTVYCQMGAEQAAFYREFNERCQKDIFEMEMGGASEAKVRMAVFKELLRLRQICADPRLVDNDFKEQHSAKLLAFRNIIEESVEGQHRVIVFSQFVAVLTLLRSELEKLELPYAYIDGQTKNRAGVCETFNNNSSIPIILVSLKAGGVGLNLTGADTVIHYDPWWNPAVEAQASDRAHRIGQTRCVNVIKLITANTVEEKVLTLQQRKRALLSDVFSASDVANAKISLADMRELLGEL